MCLSTYTDLVIFVGLLCVSIYSLQLNGRRQIDQPLFFIHSQKLIEFYDQILP